MARTRAVAMSLAILSVLLISTFSFAAAPDRITGPITTASTVSLGKGLLAHPWAKYDQGPIEPSFQLHDLAFVIAPSLSQQKAIDKLISQQQDPRSPQYRKWLTPEQYGARFGLSPIDLKKITTWLQLQGFTNVSVARSSNIIMFSGTAAQVEAVFRTQIHLYEVDGKSQFSAATSPQIPAALSGIVIGMRGLNNYHMKSMLKRRVADYHDSSYVTGQLLAPADINTIYDIPSSMDGSGQTVAIIGRSDIYEDDLSDFRTGFGLSAISGCIADPTSNVITSCDTTYFKYLLVLNGGETDPLSPDSIVPGDLVEADLDLEWSGATAPKAQIIYVNAPAINGNDVVEAMSYAITNNVAPIVSMSFGLCEYGTAVDAVFGYVEFSESEFQQAIIQGQTIVNSSGDGGATECDYEAGNNPALYGYTVNYPASSPEVTGVGGTLIPLVAPDEYNSTYWNTTGTTGGSALKYIPEQSWNEPEEIGLYCASNPNDPNCSGITDWLTAQEAFGIGAGGGGVSNCATIDTNTGECLTGYPQPSYQSGLSVTLPSPAPETTTPARYTPDVSLLASPDFPGYIFCSAQFELGGSSTSSSCSTSIADSLATWGTVAGGTSFAAPVFAGMVALLNQSLATTGLGNINPTLYSLAATPANGAFHPVITPSSGAYSNGAFCDPGFPGAPQPSQLWCPAGGFLGFNTYDFDATTNYNLVTGLGSVDLNKLALAWAASQLASTTTTLASSENPSNYGDSVTFTATVTTSGTSTPTGTVTFYDGTTQLGQPVQLGVPGVVNQATATYTTSTLSSSGSPHSITGVYSGDSNNAGSTSSVLTQTVKPATFTFVSTGAPSHTVLAGQQSLTYTFQATPTSGSTFAGALTIDCSFSPVDPTLTSSICTYTVNGGSSQTGPITIPAGSSASTVTVSVKSAGPNSGTGSQFRHRADNRLPWMPMTLPLAGIVLAGFAGRKRSKYAMVGSLCLALLMAGFLIACGNNSTPAVSVSVSPEGASLYANDTADSWPNQTASFTATVTNNSNTAVTWSLSSAVSCSSNPSPCGSIDSSGDYTAPQIVSGLPGSVTVTATSQADTTKSANATITLTPTTVPVNGGFTVTVTATETGAAAPATPTVTLVVN